MLATEPVVAFFSLWVAFSWAVLYLTFGAIPLVYSTRHGFSVEQNGAVFAGKVYVQIPQHILYDTPPYTRASHVCWGYFINDPQHLAREGRSALWKDVVDTRRAPLLQLR